MRRLTRGGLVVAVVAALLAIPSFVVAAEHFATPLFGLGTDGSGAVVVADAPRGVAAADGDLIAALPGVTDVAASDQGWLWAITGGGAAPSDAKLYKIHAGGTVEEFADLAAFEAKRNPHPAFVDSNPYSVVDLGGGEALVADAAGNTLVKVNKHGKVKLVAILPDEVVSTDNAKALVEEALTGIFEFPVSCDDLPPGVPPEAEEVCSLPPAIPAEAVPTSVAIGPDGAFYVGELKGFPAPLGESRVWRIASNARNADCAISPLCAVVHDGFTSIVDLDFGDDGTLYVAELDEKSWFAVELALFEGLPIALGLGTVNACTPGCAPLGDPIFLLSAITVDGAGDLWFAGLGGPVAPLP